MFEQQLYIFGSVLLVSVISLVGVLLLSLQETLLRKILLYLVSFSTGALLGNVFLHLLPEVVEQSEAIEKAMLIVLVGILLSFVLEKFIHWRHCHTLDCDPHVHPVGPLMIMGDAVHNILDGILIATAYLASIPLGIATTVAVILHEIPQEMGDFGILVHSGYTKKQALIFNLLSALTAFLGAAIVLGAHEYIEGIENIFLPIVAGNFLYIASVDLIPELHKENRPSKAALQLFWMLAGIGLMYTLAS